jgi:hypothetical protein
MRGDLEGHPTIDASTATTSGQKIVAMLRIAGELDRRGPPSHRSGDA